MQRKMRCKSASLQELEPPNHMLSYARWLQMSRVPHLLA